MPKIKHLTPLNNVFKMFENETLVSENFNLHTLIMLHTKSDEFLNESFKLSQKITNLDSRIKCKIIEAHEWNDESIFLIKESMNFKNENHFIIIPKGINHSEDEIIKVFSTTSSQYFEIKDTLPVNRISINNLTNWQACQVSVSNEKSIFIFGDVHESLDAWQNLSKKVPDGTLQISLGDIFDKGFDTERVLEFTENFIANGNKIIVGNHESYVARRLLNLISAAPLEADYFTSLDFFQKNDNLAERFLNLYKVMLPFVRLEHDDKIFYLSHAPCYVEHLGKLNKQSQQFQRNFFFSSRNPERMKADLSFLDEKEEDNLSYPTHVFGHINHRFDSITRGNKIWLDTSAVYGNKLTGLLMEYQKPMIELSVPSECRIPLAKIPTQNLKP